MTWSQLKLTAGVAVLLVGSTATVAISQSIGNEGLTPQQIAIQAQDAYAALSSYSDSGEVVVEGGGMVTKTAFNIRLQRPNLYRVDWTQTGGFYTAMGVTWSDGSGDYFMMGAAGLEKNSQPQRMNDMQQAFAAALGVSSGATTIPATFYRQNFGDILAVPALGGSKLKREGDENIGDVNCFVISSILDGAKLPTNTGNTGKLTTRLWIGKEDHLIHQMQTMTEGVSIPLQESDSDVRTILERQNKPVTPEAIAALRAELEKSTSPAQGGKIVFTQKHENIVVNKKFSPSDFGR
jgi:outer membrane lipoprotein-sorting protein